MLSRLLQSVAGNTKARLFNTGLILRTSLQLTQFLDSHLADAAAGVQQSFRPQSRLEGMEGIPDVHPGQQRVVTAPWVHTQPEILTK